MRQRQCRLPPAAHCHHDECGTAWHGELSRLGLHSTAAGAERWPEPVRQAGAQAQAQAQARLQALRQAAVVFWASQRKWLKTWYVKLLAAGAVLLGLATVAANVWGVRALNANVLPSATVAVSRALDREVGGTPFLTLKTVTREERLLSCVGDCQHRPLRSCSTPLSMSQAGGFEAPPALHSCLRGPGPMGQML